VLVQTKRCIARVRPSESESHAGGRLERRVLDHLCRAAPQLAAFLARTIVGKKEDDRIVPLVELIKMARQLTDILIDRVNTAGVGRHDRVEFLALVVV
jgi:hypothetical protein